LAYVIAFAIFLDQLGRRFFRCSHESFIKLAQLDLVNAPTRSNTPCIRAAIIPRLGRDPAFSVLMLCWVFNPAYPLLAFRTKRPPGGRYRPIKAFVDKQQKMTESAAWQSIAPKSYSPSLGEHKDE